MKKLSRKQLIQKSIEIAAKYAGNLTVRQLYYRLVALGYIVPTEKTENKEYKRLIAALSKARLQGEFPFDWLLDRTREVRAGRFTRNEVSVSKALDDALLSIASLPGYIGRDRWFGQRDFVSVWVEKDALAGVFEIPCNDLGVSWFVLRGYSSLSSLHDWCLTAATAARVNPSIEQCTILYFGDHDPDGFEIPRSAFRNVKKICAVDGLEVPPIRLERVGLSMAQIQEFNPPPFGAKVSSSRYQAYVDEHGTTSAWELDALEPSKLDSLIRESVDELFDPAIMSENRSIIRGLREEMRAVMTSDDWLAEALSELE